MSNKLEINLTAENRSPPIEKKVVFQKKKMPKRQKKRKSNAETFGRDGTQIGTFVAIERELLFSSKPKPNPT